MGINMLMCLTGDGMVFVSVPLCEREIQRMLVVATSKLYKPNMIDIKMCATI